MYGGCCMRRRGHGQSTLIQIGCFGIHDGGGRCSRRWYCWFSLITVFRDGAYDDGIVTVMVVVMVMVMIVVCIVFVILPLMVHGDGMRVVRVHRHGG